jgi:hypothetical protein
MSNILIRYAKEGINNRCKRKSELEDRYLLLRFKSRRHVQEMEAYSKW